MMGLQNCTHRMAAYAIGNHFPTAEVTPAVISLSVQQPHLRKDQAVSVVKSENQHFNISIDQANLRKNDMSAPLFDQAVFCKILKSKF